MSWLYSVLSLLGLKPRMAPEFEQFLTNAIKNAKGYSHIKKDENGKWISEQVGDEANEGEE